MNKNPANASAELPEKVGNAIRFLAQNGYLGYLFGMATSARDRDLFKLSLWMNLIMAPALLLSLIFIGVLFTTRPAPLTFGLTQDLQVVPFIPLNEEYIDQANLNNWAAETAVKTLSLSFTHFNQQLEDVHDRYFDEAFEQVLASLEKAQFLPTIRGDGNTQPANSNATLTAPAVVVGKGLVDGVMNWRIEFPVVIGFEFRGGASNVQKRLAIVIVQRIPVAENPRGVKIRQFNLEQM